MDKLPDSQAVHQDRDRNGRQKDNGALPDRRLEHIGGEKSQTHERVQVAQSAARFDDLKLKEFHQTVDKTSPIITLLSPAETEHGYFAEIGYVGSEATGQVPGPQTVWTQDGTGKLTQTTPVKLTYSREEDMSQDFYRPAAIARLSGRVENGKATALWGRTAAPSATRNALTRLVGFAPPGPDRATV